MGRITHFDMAADNPEELVEFYSSVFGWEFEKWDGDAFDYWLIRTGPDGESGINGGIGRSGPDDPTGVVDVLDVKDVDARLVAVQASGGKVVRPKALIPGIGWFALFSDPQGIIFGMMQSDENAGT